SDADSTPAKNDIVGVEADLVARAYPFSVSSPLLDDGSSNVVPQIQSALYEAEDCHEDPLLGICYCQLAYYSTRSGDTLLGDSVYTREHDVFSVNRPPLLADCALSTLGRQPLLFAPSSSIDISLRATDSIGNVSTWPVPFQVTTGINSFG